MSEDKGKILGIIAEYRSPGDLLEAAKQVRDSAYSKFDCHSPFPIHGMDAAMGLKRSNLAQIVAIVSFFAVIGGLYLQYWTNAVDYPLIISGKPLVSYQAYAPVGFGIAVLTAAITTFVLVLVLNNLPMPYHWTFFSERFKKVTDDGFFISVEADDPKFDPEAVRKTLEAAGAVNVEVIQKT